MEKNSEQKILSIAIFSILSQKHFMDIVWSSNHLINLLKIFRIEVVFKIQTSWSNIHHR